MVALPVELLAQIFTYACTDGGYTGCSLSLVSKHIRAASRVARFHSVSLTRASPEHVSQFSSHLLAERALSSDTGATPRVRHLCLTAAKRSVGLLAYLEQSTANADDTELLQFTADAMTLLTIVAPDLLTLSLVSRLPLYIAGLPLPDIRKVSFPVLQELSVVSDRLLFSPLSDNTPGANFVGGKTVFPSLTHLHWTCEDFPSRNTLSLRPWIEAAPQLTHFRISNLNQRVEGAIPQLMHAIAPDERGVMWFPKLEHVVVQPSARPMLRGHTPHLGSAYSVHLDTLHLLRSAATCLFTLLPGRKRQDGQEAFGETAKREWLDRIVGGRGCWETCSSGNNAVSGPPMHHAGA